MGEKISFSTDLDQEVVDAIDAFKKAHGNTPKYQIITAGFRLLEMSPDSIKNAALVGDFAALRRLLLISENAAIEKRHAEIADELSQDESVADGVRDADVEPTGKQGRLGKNPKNAEATQR